MDEKINSLVSLNKEKLSEFELLLGYRFTDLRLLQKALIHASFAFEQPQACKNNETLEFLGDAVLDLVIGYILFQRYPEMREGELTKLRSALVNETHLAYMAKQIELGTYLCLGKGEDSSNGRKKASILSCAYEAVVGAIFEDGGYQVVTDFVQRFFIPAIAGKKEELLIADAKSRLQELLQEKHSEAPHYSLESAEGPSHQKTFIVSVHFQGNIMGTGSAGSKKEAEQKAAAAALLNLKEPSKNTREKKE